MAKYEVIVTRTKIEVSSITVSAKTPEEAEEKVKAILEPDYSDDSDEMAKREKRAVRVFDNNPAENADNSTEFEYEVEEA